MLLFCNDVRVDQYPSSVVALCIYRLVGKMALKLEMSNVVCMGPIFRFLVFLIFRFLKYAGPP